MVFRCASCHAPFSDPDSFRDHVRDEHPGVFARFYEALAARRSGSGSIRRREHQR